MDGGRCVPAARSRGNVVSVVAVQRYGERKDTLVPLKRNAGKKAARGAVVRRKAINVVKAALGDGVGRNGRRDHREAGIGVAR